MKRESLVINGQPSSSEFIPKGFTLIWYDVFQFIPFKDQSWSYKPYQWYVDESVALTKFRAAGRNASRRQFKKLSKCHTVTNWDKMSTNVGLSSIIVETWLPQWMECLNLGHIFATPEIPWHCRFNLQDIVKSDPNPSTPTTKRNCFPCIQGKALHQTPKKWQKCKTKQEKVASTDYQRHFRTTQEPLMLHNHVLNVDA